MVFVASLCLCLLLHAVYSSSVEIEQQLYYRNTVNSKIGDMWREVVLHVKQNSSNTSFTGNRKTSQQQETCCDEGCGLHVKQNSNITSYTCEKNEQSKVRNVPCGERWVCM